MRTRVLLALAVLLPVAVAASPPPSAGCRRMAARLATLEARVAEAAALASPRLLARLARHVERAQDRCVRLNEIQVIGTHNSYHVEARPALMSLLLQFEPTLFETLQYSHLPLDRQLSEQGIRQIELDVFADPDGGLFARRPVLALVGDPPESDRAEMSAPGLKVLHVQDVDFESTCHTFRACLAVVRAWSDAHPGHLPIMVLVEAKDDLIPDPLGLGFAVPVQIGPAVLDEIDATIREVFPRRQLLTPDDVRGRRDTLESAVLEAGWPALGRARGRVLFALDNGGRVRDDYRGGRRTLEGRAMFVSADPSEPDAGFVKENDPLGDPARIPALVDAGYVVRTRADADTVQSRSGDVTQRDAALASGAQWVSTDYPVADPRFTSYRVELPGGGVARCNPVASPAVCRSGALEPGVP